MGAVMVTPVQLQKQPAFSALPPVGLREEWGKLQRSAHDTRNTRSRQDPAPTPQGSDIPVEPSDSFNVIILTTTPINYSARGNVQLLLRRDKMLSLACLGHVSADRGGPVAQCDYQGRLGARPSIPRAYQPRPQRHMPVRVQASKEGFLRQLGVKKGEDAAAGERKSMLETLFREFEPSVYEELLADEFQVVEEGTDKMLTKAGKWGLRDSLAGPCRGPALLMMSM
jgi:hypothetical protein